mmetsp:Transcript_14150/g.22394  ORF Transcript_14150/g.22394 Transcript_14150/m.22394 type:complete len:80 (+) Transcript_14150:80-319(+)
MGGGARFPPAKNVWSPAGGWWHYPAQWQKNTAICMAGIFIISAGIVMVGERNSRIAYSATGQAEGAGRWKIKGIDPTDR